MRAFLLETLKAEIESTLRNYVREEGVELYIAANDNPSADGAEVTLEAVENIPLEGKKLLSEIRVILGILGRPWQCDTLVNGIYRALQPHNITLRELTVLLMSLHAETVHCVRPRMMHKRAVIRYIVEVHEQKNAPPAREERQVEEKWLVSSED